MHEFCLAHLDKTRPVLVLTRPEARPAMRRVTVAPVTTTVKHLRTELPVGPANGLDLPGVVTCDNIVTIDAALLGRHVGFLHEHQELLLARAIAAAFSLRADDWS